MSDSTRIWRLSPRAEADLEAIWIYTFEHWSADQADRYQSRIIAAIEALADGSKTGRPTPIRTGYHKHPAGSHIVFYRPSDASPDVIRILHQRMDVAAHL